MTDARGGAIFLAADLFTGIVGAIGRIEQAEKKGGEALVRVACPRGFLRVDIGGSIAVDGICLTVARLDGDSFDSHWSEETLARVVAPAAGRAAHLELPLKMGDPIGGHFVTGHIDGVGRVIDFPAAADGLSRRLTLSPPASVAPFLLAKGSIAVNGVSLTINEIDSERCRFAARLIPHTLAATNLAALRAGDEVNIEADMLAKKSAAAD